MKSQRKLWIVFFLCVFLAYAGMLVEYGQRLWSRQHFQFYPVFLVSAIALTIARLRTSELPEKSLWRVASVPAGCSFVLLMASSWFWSPWLAALSFLLLGDALLSPAPSARQSWRLLALLITLPLGLDDQLIQELQQISSGQAGRILDAFHVPHLMRGNVLELVDKRLFVEEACSGITSVYLLLTATALYVVWAEVRLIRAVPLLLSVLWWAVVANVFRLVAIVGAHQSLDWDVATGAAHEFLGVSTMLLAALGILSTRCLIDLVLEPVRKDHRNLENKMSYLTPVVIWNFLTTQHRRRRSAPAFSPLIVKVTRQTMLASLSVFLFASGGWYWTTVARATVLNTQPEKLGRLRHGNGNPPNEYSLSSMNQLSHTTFDAVPDLAITDFDVETRRAIDEQNLFGAHSTVWNVDLLSGPGKVAIDGPFGGWHDLRICYEGQGWKFEQTVTEPVPGQRSGSNLVAVQMIDNQGSRVHLYFCLFAPAGEILDVPVGNTAERISSSLRHRLVDTIAPQPRGPWWQLQLLVPVQGQSLAPARKGANGYAAAHNFLAEFWRSREPHTDMTEVMALQHEVFADEHDAQPALRLARFIAERGYHRQAIDLLAAHRAGNPDVLLLLAMCYTETEDFRAAGKCLASAVDLLESKLLNAPNDSECRLSLSRAVAAQGRILESMYLLAEGCRHSTSPKIIDQLIQRYVVWLSTMSPEKVIHQISEIELALQFAENYEDELPAELMLTTGQSVSLPLPIVRFHHALLNGDGRWLVPLLLGTDAAAKKQFEAAVRQLDQALNVAPENPVIANNLAWVLLQQATQSSDTKDTAESVVDLRRGKETHSVENGTRQIASRQETELNRAWQLACSAVAACPQNKSFLETRDRIAAHSECLNISVSELPEHEDSPEALLPVVVP